MIAVRETHLDKAKESKARDGRTIYPYLPIFTHAYPPTFPFLPIFGLITKIWRFIQKKIEDLYETNFMNCGIYVGS